MKKFMQSDFLLKNETAVRLFEQAKDIPILDYHCHIDPEEIYNDRKFETITQVWLGGDHYKWKQMRGNGIEEKYITGDGDDYEKFHAWAVTLEKLIGNPLYHWSHLELQRYFDIYEPLTGKNSREIYDKCNLKLKELSARKIIELSKVTLICTTDDPIDDLRFHRLIKEDKSFQTQVLPCFRPDKALNIESPLYLDYISRLSEVSEIRIESYSDLVNVLKSRIRYFFKFGCKAGDHALRYVMCVEKSRAEVEAIFAKRCNQEVLSVEEELAFKTALLKELAAEYTELGWVMQIHYGCQRNVNTRMFEELGADTGFDAIDNNTPVADLARFLDLLHKDGVLPRTILYSLNPADNTAIVTVMNCFMDGKIIGKMQHGSAWWFNDNKQGMIEQMTSLANVGNLGNFIGMLTDSRSFLSYTRHEYFRRILCNLIGEWVENGEYPDDFEALNKLVSDISYYNAVRYFSFDLK